MLWKRDVVAVLTSAGIKDPVATAKSLPPLRMSEPTVQAVLEEIGRAESCCV